MTALGLTQHLRNPWLGFQAAAIAAFVVLALTTFRSIDVAAAVVATLLLVASRLLGSWSEQERRTMVLASMAVGAFVVIGLLAGFDRPYVLVTTLFILPLLLATGAVVWRGDVERRSVRWLAAGLLVLAVLLIGVLWIPSVASPAVDVLRLHESAAEALADGRNPYTDAFSVNTSPGAPAGSAFVGYAYPPTTLLAYAGSDLVFGDARWASVIAVVALLILVVRPWAEMSRGQAGALIALGMALVAYPWVGTVFWFGWTDPITLPLLLAAGLLWRKNPVLSAVLLGMAFGTKQYLILALPLMLAWSDDFRWKRTVIAGGVAVLTQLPFVLINPTAYWDATIAGSLTAPIRPDSSSLAGLGLSLPFWLVLALSVGVAIWLGRAGGAAPRFLVALAATLAVAFLIGFQAFMNYWYFIGVLAICGVVVALASSGAPTRVSHPAEPTTTRIE